MKISSWFYVYNHNYWQTICSLTTVEQLNENTHMNWKCREGIQWCQLEIAIDLTIFVKHPEFITPKSTSCPKTHHFLKFDENSPNNFFSNPICRRRDKKGNQITLFLEENTEASPSNQKQVLPYLTSDLREQWSSVVSSWLSLSCRAFCWRSALCERLTLVIGIPADWLHLTGNHALDLHASTSDLDAVIAINCPDRAFVLKSNQIKSRVT